MSVSEHRSQAPASVPCFVLTMSDTRTMETETSGRAIAELLIQAGHTVVDRQVVKDDPAEVRRVVSEHIDTGAIQAVITTGGTGISRRDSTYEALTELFEKRLDGFGELFRMLSYEQIGAAAMLSRACAGTIRKTIVFSLPGSEKAVRLAMDKLILPEIGHVVRELRR